MANYFALLTNQGAAKLANAAALGIPLKLTAMAVGDGNGQAVTPNPAATKLVNEKRRAPLNALFADPLNASQLVAEQIIPETVGGWWVRELGLYDEAGTLIAVANCPETYKPLLSEGSGRTQVIRMVLIVSSTSAVELKIDPAVVLATRKYVDDMINAHYLAAGSQLPAKDIGPIWHEDYADWMTWQTFNKNGANYTGYASRLIGSLLLDTQPTPRAGYIKSGVQNLGITTYAALRAWAIHNGLMVAPGVWQAGAIQCADNADGTTFRVFDVRAQFFRAWDDGRGVDVGRSVLSSQESQNLSHYHDDPSAIGVDPGGIPTYKSRFAKVFNSGTTSDLWDRPTSGWNGTASGLRTTSDGGTESRPINTALLSVIKF
ncbi:TPA: phage tail protein [Aeromonas veronii]